MDKESIEKRVLHLREVEQLSARQIANAMRIGRRRVARILQGTQAKPLAKRESALESYRHLIARWYQEYPHLKAFQIYERLKPYGYSGSYRSVVTFTHKFRHLKPTVYHTLTFLPGEEAQIDWFFFRHESLGIVAGFLYVLAFSRYAWGKFYPKTSFEFFLAGHLECFNHLKGLARRHRYDNLKSVILSRDHSRLEYNPQFLDFSNFFGFSIHVCNPYRGNEKGRVERLVRDVRSFLYGESLADLNDLNGKFQARLIRRNESSHRATGHAPKALLCEEKLLKLPPGSYPPSRTIPTLVSKTALVEFETNRYSVPSGCASQRADLLAYPERIEIWMNSQKVATHSRSFQRNQLIQNPLHAEGLFNRTSSFKYQRIRELLGQMDPAFELFLINQQNPEEALETAYELFTLLKTHSRSILISAVRELNQMGAFKIKALRSLLNWPAPRDSDPLWPQNPKLLTLEYPPRSLKDYDPAE